MAPGRSQVGRGGSQKAGSDPQACPLLRPPLLLPSLGLLKWTCGSLFVGRGAPGGGLRLPHVRISLQKSILLLPAWHLWAWGPGQLLQPWPSGRPGSAGHSRHGAQGSAPLLCPSKTQPVPLPSSFPRTQGPASWGWSPPQSPAAWSCPSAGSRRCPAPQRPPSPPKGQTGASGPLYTQTGSQ